MMKKTIIGILWVGLAAIGLSQSIQQGLRMDKLYAVDSAIYGRSSTSLNTLIARVNALGTPETILVINGGTWAISNNVVFPTNMLVVVQEGSGFSYVGSATTTINRLYYDIVNDADLDPTNRYPNLDIDRTDDVTNIVYGGLASSTVFSNVDGNVAMYLDESLTNDTGGWTESALIPQLVFSVFEGDGTDVGSLAPTAIGHGVQTALTGMTNRLYAVNSVFSNAYNVSSGEFTIPTNGFYFITASLTFGDGDMADNASMDFDVSVNGGSSSYGYSSADDSSDEHGLSYSATIYLEATNKLSCTMYYANAVATDPVPESLVWAIYYLGAL